MLTELTANPQYKKILISTGNILNVVGNATPLRKSDEELRDSLKLCVECASNDDNQLELKENEGRILRANKELKQKIMENARNDISIGAKLFMNRNSKDCINEAVNALMTVLNVDYVDNVVLAYHPYAAVISGATSVAADASSSIGTTKALEKWSKRNGSTDLDHLKELWNCLEEFAINKQINQLGISDLDIEALTAVCQTARVEPTIAQVNLSNCCMVPSALKEFCTQHDIQLLTHSDPEILLTDEHFILPDYTVDWCLRYQVHVRCRGVLIAKGYLLGATKRLSKE